MMERRRLFSCLIENVFVLDINLHLVTLYPPSYFVPLFSNSWFISTNNLSPLVPLCPCGNTLSWAHSSSAWIARMGVGTGSVASVSGGAWSPHFFFSTGDLYTASSHCCAITGGASSQHFFFAAALKYFVVRVMHGAYQITKRGCSVVIFCVIILAD